ncbi:uncharacterized protein LOC120839579 [Ixodes scapularis]|uniref:uncharacterized protein LOC120839579 n=1 Tax=Ixodes scapularis TaxID=6945 RepID=UPI001A9E1D7A|nr:uncharacterized protein LOC120839579 [Ixodes scapularis]
MLVFICVVAALLACSDAAKLSEQQRKGLQRKNTNNAWLLFTAKHKYYLLYRSVENDTAYGGFKPCVEISLKMCWDRSLELWYNFNYQDIYTSHLYPQMWIFMIDKSGKQKDLVRMRFDYYEGYKEYQLLFTDYETCFTLMGLRDKALQVWIIGKTNVTDVNEICHSTYNEKVNETGGLTDIPKYYIYNETTCGKKK